MKHFFWKYALIFVLALSYAGQILALEEPAIGIVGKKSVEEKLKAIPQVVEVKSFTNVSSLFAENYEVWYEQHVDPNDVDSPTFKQKVLVSHVSYDAPVIVELQGYKIWTSKAGELASLFKANQITIEHRFFDQSKPEGGIPWEYLTVANAANDQHIIIETLKRALYPTNKFISTGISKGGQTTMIHRSLYPEDVDASVCYVAPLNFQREDPRIYDFLKSVGTEQQRQQIHDFQLMCLKRKKELLPVMEQLAKEKGYSWDVELEHAFELYVLEYSFAFWQWGGYKFDQIPTEDAAAEKVLNHVLAVSGLSFFESSGVEPQRPFFWAALTEMGIYGYEHEPFKEYLSQESTYLFDFTFPKGVKQDFDPIPMRNVNTFIQEKAEKMLFIYGELDTWSATAVNLTDEAKERGLKKYVLVGGHHGTRIKHFGIRQRRDIKETIAKWIGVEAPEVTKPTARKKESE